MLNPSLSSILPRVSEFGSTEPGREEKVCLYIRIWTASESKARIFITPNPSRLDHVREMARAYRADGVVHYALQFCAPYQIEATGVERALKESGVPVLRIETDYGGEDAGQLRTRVQAFIEQIQAR